MRAVQQMPIPARRFSHIHLDLVGPLPRSKEGFNHFLMVVDCSSCWLEAFLLESISTESIADTFICGWVAPFDIPDHITSDRGPQFCSALWAQLLQRLGTLHHLTTAYHPQANSMVERSHRQLKDGLRAFTASADWPSHLPLVLLGLRADPKEDSSISSAELLYAPLWSFLASFLVCRSHSQWFSMSPQGLLHPTSPPGVPAPPRSIRRSLPSSRVLLLPMFTVAVPSRRSHLPKAGHSLWFPALASSLLCT